jgi:hypothetical protein
MMNAKINFAKEIEMDNFERGCEGSRTLVYNENISIDFQDTNELKEKMAKWLSNYFDVNENDFINYVQNECQNNRFDYNQSEDSEGNKIKITKENPNGFLADYSFLVLEVKEVKEVNYIF